MADAPWRCSQCGTINEPVANACRTCGRWPSLFDLEASTIPVEEPPTYDEADEYAAQTIDVEVMQPEVYDTAPDLSDVRDVRDVHAELESIDEEVEPPKPFWQRLASLLVPIGVVLYIIISALANRDGG